MYKTQSLRVKLAGRASTKCHLHENGPKLAIRTGNYDWPISGPAGMDGFPHEERLVLIQCDMSQSMQVSDPELDDGYFDTMLTASTMSGVKSSGCVYRPVTSDEPLDETLGFWKNVCLGPQSAS